MEIIQKILLAQPGFEPTTSRSEVNCANHYNIEASYKKGQIFHVESYNVLLFCEVKIEIPVTYNEWILHRKFPYFVLLSRLKPIVINDHLFDFMYIKLQAVVVFEVENYDFFKESTPADF